MIDQRGEVRVRERPGARRLASAVGRILPCKDGGSPARARSSGRRARPRPLLAATLAPVLAACGGPASTLTPGGPGAAGIATLWWLLLGVAVAIYGLVLAVLVWAVARRRGPERPDTSEVWPRRGVIAGGVLLPLLVLPVLLLASVRTQLALGRDAPAALTVEITGHQWWWELRYLVPGSEDPVVTANELHLPVGRRVQVRLASVDVIHSLWVPALQGKLDLIPGQTNVTWLEADEPGVFHGPCAEYCGVQHAGMVLTVIARPPAEFETWLENQRRPALPPADPHRQHGQAVFLRHCAACHAVRGTTATAGRVGPDLTHVAGRRTLAAGRLQNVKGHLAGWIADPQALKPGNRMPRVLLPARDFHAVVDYLASLR
jgi:cytochrome c oxidase subunit 2